MAFHVARILLHSAAAAVMIYGYKSLRTLPIDAQISSESGGHFQFLTIQGLFIACATALTSLVLDIFPSAYALKPVKRIFLIISMPLAVVITSIYWPLLLFATRLILRKEEDSSSSDAPQFLTLPLRTDISLHAVPAVSLLADFLLFEKKYSENELRYGAPAVSLLYTSFYAWWVERCASFNGKFPYPFLTENPFEIRLAIYCGAGTLALTSFWLINRLHN